MFTLIQLAMANDIGATQISVVAGPSQPAAAPRRSTRIRKYVYAPKHMRPGHQERPLQSTLLLQARFKALLIHHGFALPSKVPFFGF